MPSAMPGDAMPDDAMPAAAAAFISAPAPVLIANTSIRSHMSQALRLPSAESESCAGTPNTLHPRDRSVSPSLRKVQVPRRMRSRFLEEVSQLPPHLLQHLEQYIPPPAAVASPLSSYTSRSKHHLQRATSGNSTTGDMDMGPDLFDSAGETDVEPDNSNPQAESSTAAQERANANMTHCNGHVDHTQAPSPPSTPDTTATEWYEDALESNDPDLRNANATYKSWTTTAVTMREHVVYTSLYTRPAEELLREILEVRYPRREAGDAARRKGWCCNFMERLRAMFSRDGYERIEEPS